MNGLRRCGAYTQWNTTQPEKKNKIMPFAATWMELENLSEVSQKEKEIPYDINVSGIQHMAQRNLSTEKKIMDLENRLVVAKREGDGMGGTGSLG